MDNSFRDFCLFKFMSVKTSVRFKIFERDNFTCQYCGRKPPEVILHCDHIHPRSKGGQDEELNLITSCRDCNLGKKDKILKNPQRPDIKLEIENLKEAENQIKEYYKYLKKLSKYKENDPIIDLICEVWTEQSGNQELTESGKNNLKQILKNNTAEDIIEAIKISWLNGKITIDNKWPYMCGVLKQLKLKRNNPEKAKEFEETNRLYYKLVNYWKNQSRGSGYVTDYMLKKWITIYSEDEIKEAMDIANGYWSELKNLLEQ